jgi:hypothetical protein
LRPQQAEDVRVVAVHGAVEHSLDGLQRDDDALEELEARALVDGAGTSLVHSEIELVEEFPCSVGRISRSVRAFSRA